MSSLPGGIVAGTSDCLLVIDVQNDFCENGALEVPDANSTVAVINDLALQFDNVVATQDWHPAGHSSFASEHAGKAPMDIISMPYGPQTLWPDHCIAGSEGANFHKDLDTKPLQNIIRKGFHRAIDSYSAFYENDHTTATGLTGYLRERGITRVILAGLAFDFCVRYSAEDARREGFDTIVLESACRGIDFNGSVDESRNAMTASGVLVVN